MRRFLFAFRDLPTAYILVRTLRNAGSCHLLPTVTPAISGSQPNARYASHRLGLRIPMIRFCDLIEIPYWLFIVGTISINREPVLQIKDQGPIV